MGYDSITAFNVALGILNDLNESEIMDKILGTSKESFMSLIGTIVDSYGYANNMSSEDVLTMMELLLKTMRDVHEELGDL